MQFEPKMPNAEPAHDPNSSISENIETIAQRIKRVDPDRYRAALLAPKQARNDLLLLYAFHYELAKVPEYVSEPMLGEIRYQWWRDCIAEIYEGKPVRAHEVSTPLASLIRRRNVPRYWVDQLIDGRARDLDPTPFANIEAAQDYAAATSGVLMKLAVHVIRDNGAGSINEAQIAAAGQVWGLIGLARAYGFYHDSMLSALDWTELMEACRNRYALAKGKVPAFCLPACAYAGLVPGFIKRLDAADRDPKSRETGFSSLSKQVRLFTTTLRGRI